MTRDIVEVSLAQRSYDIIIGDNVLDDAGELFIARLPKARAAIVTDTNVENIHLSRLQNALEKSGVTVTPIVVPAGEKSKSFPMLEQVVEKIIAAKLERGDCVIALGGGVVGDLTGFAASVVRRGMNFIQVPTTLLAQVDSSVGGKTGINSPQGKNLIGAFYQPRLVMADTTTLNTLPLREFRAGYAEVVKYGLIDQPDFFMWLEKNREAVFAGGEKRIEAIARSCRAKAAVVARDEHEGGERALLNLGHTFGHALEAAVHYDSARLVHGEAVAIGMVMAHQFSAMLGLLNADVATRVAAHLKEAGLPTRLQDVPGLPDAKTLLSFIMQDKKVSRGHLTFILSRSLGEAFIAKDVAADQVLAFLESCFDAAC